MNRQPPQARNEQPAQQPPHADEEPVNEKRLGRRTSLRVCPYVTVGLRWGAAFSLTAREHPHRPSGLS